MGRKICVYAFIMLIPSMAYAAFKTDNLNVTNNTTLGLLDMRCVSVSSGDKLLSLGGGDYLLTDGIYYLLLEEGILGGEPAVSPANMARLFYNCTSQTLMISVNGTAYTAIGSGSGGGGTVATEKGLTLGGVQLQLNGVDLRLP